MARSKGFSSQISRVCGISGFLSPPAQRYSQAIEFDLQGTRLTLWTHLRTTLLDARPVVVNIC